MDSHSDIANTVLHDLYHSSPPSNLRELIDHLVESEILTEEECDRHHDEISLVFNQWLEVVRIRDNFRQPFLLQVKHSDREPSIGENQSSPQYDPSTWTTSELSSSGPQTSSWADSSARNADDLASCTTFDGLSCGPHGTHGTTERDSEGSQGSSTDNGNPSGSVPPVASQTLDFNETGTTYSASETGSEMSTDLRPRDRAYAKSMAADLFEALRWSNDNGMDEAALDQAFDALPDLLRAFAQRLGYKAQSAMHRDIMYFVQKNRQ